MLLKNNSTFILAEIAQSYEGDIDTLLSICENATRTGLDGIMFQVIYADEIALPENNKYDYFKQLEFEKNQLKQVVDVVHQGNKKVFAEVFGLKSANVMKEVGADVCSDYKSNEGAYSSCQRGVAQRNAEMQRRLENEAYNQGLGK